MRSTNDHESVGMHVNYFGPFVSRHSKANLVAGMLDEGEQLVVESLMPSGGVIFSDGIESDFLVFSSGTIARIGVSDQVATLVVP